MTFYKTTAAFGATACLLLASGAFADATYDGTFDGDTGAGTWTGGTIEEAEVAAPTPAGLPISSATVTGNKVYSIAGSANSGTLNVSGAPFADMMVKVSIPDTLESLDTGTGGDAEGAKFAIAVAPVTDNNVVTGGQFKYWNGSAWANVSDTTYADGAWVRVTMKFDYTNKKCTVALNGNTCGTYDLLDLDNNASALASIEVKGSTAIDEVKVASGTLPAFADDTAKVDGATYATKKWLTANDVTWPADSTAAATLDAQYKFGLDPKGTATTLPLSFEQDADSTKATLSFPGFGAYGGTGTYVLQSKTGSADWADTADTITSASGVNTASVTLPSTVGTAVYYRIKANPASN